MKIKAPDSADCGSNLHEYTAQLGTFLTSELIQGRVYDEEAQVITFLQGLDPTYQTAVQYINNLLDSSGQPGINPKVQFQELPQTIETYMERNPPTNTSPFVRMLQHLTPSNDIQSDMICKLLQKSTQNEPRKSIDVYCDACGGHGNMWK
jgi:hypothetical protein